MLQNACFYFYYSFAQLFAQEIPMSAFNQLSSPVNHNGSSGKILKVLGSTDVTLLANCYIINIQSI